MKRALYKLPGVFGMYAFVLAVVWLLRALVRQERLHQVVISARLSNLRAQLQPHFLFNTLNSTASLVRSGDREGAIESLVDLSDLLRRSLSAPVRHRVPLREELAFLTTYLAIQKRRFGDRLRVSVQVDEGVSDARVPFLVLQPVVENAVRHGLNLQKRPGEIHVTVRREGDGLIIEVQDSGSEETPSHGFGIGLENLRERLGHLYGSMFRLSLQRRRGGTCVSLAIPYVVQDD